VKTILVVDDQEGIRKIYKTALRKEGYFVLEAKNAVEADDIVETSDVDLMLLDIKMPEVDGTILYDVAKLFKKKLKVIVCSVYSVDDQKILIKGATDYFDKSEGIKALKSKIKKIFSEN